MDKNITNKEINTITVDGIATFIVGKKPKPWRAIRIFGDRDEVEVVELRLTALGGGDEGSIKISRSEE